MNEYSESIASITSAMESELSLLDLVIRHVESFSGSISALLQQLSRIPYDLPNRRDRRTIFGVKSIFRRDRSIDFSGFEPNFVSCWSDLSSSFLLQQPGLLELNDSLRSVFSARLRTVRDSYGRAHSDFSSLCATADRDLRAAECECAQAQAQYIGCGGRIEELRQRLESEHSEDQALRLQQALSAARTEFSLLQDAAVCAVDRLNAQRERYSLAAERGLSLFECAERERESQMAALLRDLSDAVSSYASARQSATQRLQDQVESISVEEELKLYKEDTRNMNITDISYEIGKLPFEISAVLQPRALFEPELSYSGAVVIKGYSRQKEGELDLVEGERILIKDYMETPCRIQKEATKEEGYAPPECYDVVPELQRALHRVTKDYDAAAPDELSVVCDEYVMSVETTEKGMVCVNAYRQKGLVPFDVLEETINC